LAYIYTGESLFQVFLIAAAMFGTMAVYGTVTKSDLSSMRNILMMALIGLIIASLINMFLQSTQFNMLIACVGVGAFSLLTAYDVQMLRRLGHQAVGTQEEVNKIALMGALSLYLNVINLFIYLLQLFGKKRNN
jgi:FtsH-binding integral membrane protein